MTKDLADELERLALKDGFCVFALRAFVDDNLPAILSALRGEEWQGIETAPFDRPFYARSADGDVALCWRFKPSSRTDQILRWGFHRNREFKNAVDWRYPDPLPPPPTKGTSHE